MTVSDLEVMIGPNEKILWRGRPDKKCFILKGLTRGIFSVIPIFELQVIFMTVVMALSGFFSTVMEEADIHSDIMYPNDLRPQANRGYQTQTMG